MLTACLTQSINVLLLTPSSCSRVCQVVPPALRRWRQYSTACCRSSAPNRERRPCRRLAPNALLNSSLVIARASASEIPTTVKPCQVGARRGLTKEEQRRCRSGLAALGQRA